LLVELKGILDYADRKKLAQINANEKYVLVLVPQVTRQVYAMWKAGVVADNVLSDNLSGLGIVTWAWNNGVIVHPVCVERNHKSWLDLEEYLMGLD